MAHGYDVYVPQEIDYILKHELDADELRDFRAAIASLLNDPTTDNPYVRSAAFLSGFDTDEFALIWNRLVIVFRWVNHQVIELRSLRVNPR